jgi:molybdate transport system substrate-binding protein
MNSTPPARLIATFAALLLPLFTPPGAALHAAEIKVLSGNGARAAVTELAARFERASGHKVTIDFYVNSDVKRKIEAGESFDVAVLNPPVLDGLIRLGRVVSDTRGVLGRAGIGAAVRSGAPKPDISTVPAFKRALLAANGVTFPGEGASGKYFVSVVERMGISREMQPKLRPMPAENNVELVAKGEVDMVVVVASRIAGVPGVDYLGPIPQELQTWIGFAAGAGRDAKQPAAARELIRYFTSPAAEPVLRSLGVEPFVE